MVKKKKKPAADQVAWIRHLPDEGGAWGRSILTTVDAMEKDLDPLRDEFEALSEKIVAREDIVKGAVKRADKEALGLFNKDQIAAAKKKMAEAEDKPEEEDSSSEAEGKQDNGAKGTTEAAASGSRKGKGSSARA